MCTNAPASICIRRPQLKSRISGNRVDPGYRGHLDHNYWPDSAPPWEITRSQWLVDMHVRVPHKPGVEGSNMSLCNHRMILSQGDSLRKWCAGGFEKNLDYRCSTQKRRYVTFPVKLARLRVLHLSGGQFSTFQKSFNQMGVVRKSLPQSVSRLLISMTVAEMLLRTCYCNLLGGCYRPDCEKSYTRGPERLLGLRKMQPAATIGCS